MKAARLSVKVVPGASLPLLERLPDGSLRCKVREPAHEGQANEAVLSALSAALKLPKTSFKMVRGGKSRNKTVAVSGITVEELEQRIKERLT